MQIGLIGAGNMGSAMARGWGVPVLASDSGSGRAAALVGELGGEALTDNAELARRADLVVLAHKPAQLEAIAAQAAPHAERVLSLLGRGTLAELRAAYPGARVTRVEPNTPVALRQGVLVVPADDEDEDAEVLDLLAQLGTVVRVPEALMGVAGAISGVGPAYVALVAEAWADAAVRAGLPAATATQLVSGTLSGAAALLERSDTLSVRRAVTSPGGTTARGLAALEREGLRRAFAAAMDDVVDFES
ncbi:MAG: pyrroline-5-carboxylate reductase [Solirubrobacteraceae bacterium]|jgi:pyrroline-5-carboxylate reductase|nr:pyrroline-5-carboxylate reductase [Solirubrobacteraceae bacterium]